MAFTAVHYPTDKDQGHIPYWPGHEELGVASENFFDQFVTFDGSDPTAVALNSELEDPPSPSILLDSLHDDFTNSSASDQGTQSGQAQSESSATSVSLDAPLASFSEPAPSDGSKSVPPDLTNHLLADPVLSGGSISDSELLRLEGISLKSPRPNVTAPSSPPFAPRSPSPRKRDRVLDSIYATFRRATQRSKPRKQAGATAETTLSDIFKGGEHTYDIPENVHLGNFGGVKLEDTPCPVDSHGIPVSPPLTGRIPPDQNSNDIMSFINGHVDDPFCDGLPAPPATINPSGRNYNTNLHTPIDTPALDEEIFLEGMGILDPNGTSYRPQPKLRSTSSAEWPMEGLLTNEGNTNLWSSGSPQGLPYVPGTPGWWDTANGHPHHHRGGPPLNLSMHNGHPDIPYEYGADPDLAGLMIHMPQPRAPQAAVLSSPVINDAYYGPPTPRHHRRHYSEQRRPRPRAPSSGARHYGPGNGNGGGGPYTPLTSPRKMSSGSSANCYTLREEPPSPTPPQRHRSASGTGSALAVRKRRSWRGRQNIPAAAADPRTPGRSVSSSCRPSVSYESLHHPHPHPPHGPARRVSMSNMRLDGELNSSSSGSGRRGGGGGGGSGAMSIEFCNYTPSDKKVLMNGVAPSGSSKTKARREREAQEHKRKMSEAYMQAIRAAGGDVEKLRQNGFFSTGSE
ncbi:hypothetical protein F5B19DRAFT_65014 [Rostrohypoxylon terebratum]|nr:hypothetical protein F5B19DRAFT_65014 [Rostrohypoxylon terebratum]